ncbi:MAG: hydrogenase maturation protease [Planctomycetota bacterium]|jgi:hydrogenase maturation protease
MTDGASNILIIGYGNPGRLDDGLGPALIDALEEKNLPGVTLEADYQLTVENAADLRECDAVLFVDADVAGSEPFTVRRLTAGEASISFSTHHISPEGVVALAKDMFDAEPEAFVMGIRGYDFNEFGERLSQRAQQNLAAAVDYVMSAVDHRTFTEVGCDGGDADCQADRQKEDNPCKMESM